MTEKLKFISNRKTELEAKLGTLKGHISGFKNIETEAGTKLAELLEDIELQLDNLESQLGTILE